MTDVLKASGINMSFGGLKVLTDVSFTVSAGEIVAFVGPNGAGKTTLFNALSGYVAPTSGSVQLLGNEIAGKPPSAIAQAGMRRTFQNGGVFGGMTVYENVLCGFHSQIHSGLFATLFSMRGACIAEAKAEKWALELIGRTDLGPLADHFAKELSGGQQRMLEIIRTIASQPPVVLLDEPAVGLSPSARKQMADMIRELARKNIAVLLIEHSVELVMSISDRIVVLNGGIKIADGPPDEVRDDPVVLEAYLG